MPHAPRRGSTSAGIVTLIGLGCASPTEPSVSFAGDWVAPLQTQVLIHTVSGELRLSVEQTGNELIGGYEITRFGTFWPSHTSDSLFVAGMPLAGRLRGEVEDDRATLEFVPNPDRPCPPNLPCIRSCPGAFATEIRLRAGEAAGESPSSPQTLAIVGRIGWAVEGPEPVPCESVAFEATAG